jgi:hypothetical protein
MGWGAAHAGKERERSAGPRVAHAGKRGKKGWAGPRLLGWAAALFSSFLFFSTLKPLNNST